MSAEKMYPNAVFGCGHLSPIGWCGECAMKKLEVNSSYGKKMGVALFECGHLSLGPDCAVCGNCEKVEEVMTVKEKTKRMNEGDVWRDDVSGEIGQAFDEVLDELDRATVDYGSMAGAHEGYAVILEELDELWTLVKKKQKDHGRYKPEMRHEACQVAAMAIRFMLDVCGDDLTERADEYTETDE